MAEQPVKTIQKSRGGASFMPILGWLPQVDRSWLAADIIGGLTRGLLPHANALTVREQIKTLLAETHPGARALVLDLAAQDTLDITSAGVLKGLFEELKRQGAVNFIEASPTHPPASDPAAANPSE